MKNMNLINYDTETDVVELLPASKNFAIYIEIVKKDDIHWSYFYVGLSSIILAGSISISFGLFKWVTSFQWVLFFGMIFNLHDSILASFR
jgi:hypothetical protein